MRLNYIYIDGYKNLSKLEIDLDSESSMIGFIGNNGSGKSNVIEALTNIFSKVKTGQPIDFKFCIKYDIDEKSCEINNLKGDTVALREREALPQSRFATVLPSTLFLYYCGETNRLHDFAISAVDDEFERVSKGQGETRIKFLTYLTVEDFGAALLSNYVFGNQTCTKIFDLVNVELIKLPVIFRFKNPGWSERGKAEELWRASGASRTEIEKLFSISEDKKGRIVGKNVEVEINDINAFKRKWFSSLDLFMALKMLSQAGLLDSIDFEVKKKDGNAFFDYKSLSEGEKQLGQLLSILDITKDHRALFLLDEFDSYLHPSWQRKFAEIIRSIDIRGQVFFTTHSPLTLTKMEKEEIINLKDGKAEYSKIDTYNRDASEVMEEIMSVGKRSDDIQLLIKKFKNAALQTKKEEAMKYLGELNKLLSQGDPFFDSAQYYIARLG